MSLLTNLISHWKLNEASGTRNDSHGSNHLTDNNTVGSTVGKIGNAADLVRNNSENFSSTSSDLDLTSTQDWSFSVWVYPIGRNGYYTILRDGGSKKWILIDPSGILWRYSDFQTTTISTDTWTHILYTYQSTGADTGIETLYVNGVQVGQRTGSVPAPSNAVFLIGAIGTGGTHEFNGAMDSVSFWKDRALTAADVTELYNSGSGLDYESFGGGTVIARKRRILLV